ncbi:MAG: hypothetical protein LAN37_01425 [Acidobacteriia bacterium]|nr:hypothetical protein [Terriglobia bacterium]
MLCALALAGILISPAVPSPPTVVGKAIGAAVSVLVAAVLPPPCSLRALVMRFTYGAPEMDARAAEPGSGDVAIPLLR